MSALAQPTPCPCGHTINFKKSEVFYTKKSAFPLVRKMSALDKPLSLTADVFYGRPLSYDVIFTLIFLSLDQHSLSFGPRANTALLHYTVAFDILLKVLL